MKNSKCTETQEIEAILVKHIERGINLSYVNEIYCTADYLGKGFRIGIVAVMIALTEATTIGRTFASMKDYECCWFIHFLLCGNR
ncbi:hypothetical protein VNO80_27085 [Phaseolus coccineus]|uniref:Uncharacterized protein n=1 Tax=Phaseolus coccineus TaxID=3886 RepID=A0AAN9LFY5_PHACN